MAIDVLTYELPGGAAAPSLPPQDVRDLYATGSFPKAVRDWHLDRLPRMLIRTATYRRCPYCNKQKDSRSFQIDHVIPHKIFIRYRLYLTRHSTGKDTPASTALADLQIRANYSERQNLVLACMRCNAVAQDAMPTLPLIAAVIAAYPGAMANNFAYVQGVVTAINNLPAFAQNYVLNGPHWNTSRMETRTRTASPYGGGGANASLQRQLTNQSQSITRILTGGRPDWSAGTLAALQVIQGTHTVADQEGRLCFYCLGLFKKQSFQIDHINPASGRSPARDVYNDPTNLIPVCRTCNTSKGDSTLTATWLDAQIVRRQTDGLEGVEHSRNTANASAAAGATYQAAMRVQRVRVLGL